ncbi:MAG: DUF86 domain-containing protein [bacterium]
MPPREPVALLTDALAQIDDLLAKAARSSLVDLLENRDLQAIFERRFEVLGEALRRLERSDPLVFARVAGGAQAIALRNFIAHGYDGVDHRVLWDTVAEDLPAMRTSIARLLESEARDS